MLSAVVANDASAAGETVAVGAEASSRLVTVTDFRRAPAGLVVESIKWDSGFRATGLQPGDRIVAVDGQPIIEPASEEARKSVIKLVGQLGEPQAMAEAGRKDGDPLTLTVRRKKPPHGWETFDVTGALRAERHWRNAEGRVLFGPSGPDQMASDGFTSAWSSWYEKATAAWDRARAWHRQGLAVSAADLDAEESTARVAKLAERYPGPFTDAVAADWAAMQAIVQGRTYQLEPGALDYRQLGEQRVKQIAEAGTAARSAFLAAHAADVIPAFPSIDPITGDRAALAGKLVELPKVTQREWVSQGDRTVFVFAQGDHCYLAEVGGATERMIVTQRRYERLVSPSIPPEYEIVAKVLPEVTMVVYADRAYFALKVEPVAATVGSAFFVDLSTGADPAAFAGEEILHHDDVAPPGPDTAPEQIVEAMVAALKLGQLELWKSLFADWTFFVGDDGRPVLSPWGPSNHEQNWEQGRRQILGDVVDVRVVWTDDPATVFTGKEFDGAPTIEQTTVEVDHLRQEPDGSARSVTARGLTRLWTLQRLNGGPWRISTNAGI